MEKPHILPIYVFIFKLLLSHYNKRFTRAGSFCLIIAVSSAPGMQVGRHSINICSMKKWRFCLLIYPFNSHSNMKLLSALWSLPSNHDQLLVPFLWWSASLVAQTVKNSPAMKLTGVWSLGLEDPLQKGMATHSSILAWRIPWTEESGRLPCMGSQRVRHDWVPKHSDTCIIASIYAVNAMALFYFFVLKL